MPTGYKDRNDVERSWMVDGAPYDNDIPRLSTSTVIPTTMFPFSKRKLAFDSPAWVHFYEPDGEFIQILNQPRRYLKDFKRVGGIISPDFSIYADDPWPIQVSNKYWNHAYAYWLSTENIPVIPNVRW